jgi:hypothetical protein
VGHEKATQHATRVIGGGRLGLDEVIRNRHATTARPVVRELSAPDTRRKRNRGFPSGTSDLRKPVVSALVFRLNDGSVTVTNVAFFTEKCPARVADELAALQTAPGDDDVTSLGTPTSSSLAALSGK